MIGGTLTHGGTITFHDGASDFITLAPGDHCGALPERIARKYYDRLAFDNLDWLTERLVTADVPRDAARYCGMHKSTDRVIRPRMEPFAPVPGVTPVMISNTKRPREIVNETITSLSMRGVHPFIQESSEPPAREENRRVAYQALLEAYARGSAALFLEDDIEADEYLPWALESAAHTNRICYLYLAGTYTPRAVDEWLQDADRDRALPFGMARLDLDGHPSIGGRPDRSGWRTLVGSQAIYLPAWAVDAVIRDARYWVGDQTSFDIYLRTLALERVIDHHDDSWWPVTFVPNPIQHRGATCLVSAKRQPHESPTFGRR